MEDVIRAVPASAVQETSFEDDQVDALHHQDEETAPIRGRSDLEDELESNHEGSKLTDTTKSPTRAQAPDVLRGLLMVLLALDQTLVLLSPWPQDSPSPSQSDIADSSTALYALHHLTSIAAPGILFLFGLGFVYYAQARRAQGWSSLQIARHLLIRAILLTIITAVLGLIVTGGKVWFWNRLLFALAIDYLIAGLLWLFIAHSEERVAFWLLRVLPDSKEDDVREPLLASRRGLQDAVAPDRKIMRAADLSWHLHNVVVLGASAVVTIWWNLWLAPPVGGRECRQPDDMPRSVWFRIWFDPVQTEHVSSTHPPLAWLSFALLGLLYGRLLLAKPWTHATLTLSNAFAGLAFLTIFVLTRVLRLGNLTSCLHPVVNSQASSNPYLASPRAFFSLVNSPPDVAFWAYSMGANFILLAIVGILPARAAGVLFHPLLVYGTSAMFFYTAHLLLLALCWLFWAGVWHLPTARQNPWTVTKSAQDQGRHADPQWVFWLTWLGVLAVLYPLCRGFAFFKRTRGPESIWKFF